MAALERVERRSEKVASAAPPRPKDPLAAAERLDADQRHRHPTATTTPAARATPNGHSAPPNGYYDARATPNASLGTVTHEGRVATRL